MSGKYIIEYTWYFISPISSNLGECVSKARVQCSEEGEGGGALGASIPGRGKFLKAPRGNLWAPTWLRETMEN